MLHAQQWICGEVVAVIRASRAEGHQVSIDCGSPLLEMASRARVIGERLRAQVQMLRTGASASAQYQNFK